jgi:hypothetical protein
MKIVYATVAEEIRRAVRRADEQQRTIEKIELTPREWHELRNELYEYGIVPKSAQLIGTHMKFMGVIVVREDAL